MKRRETSKEKSSRLNTWIATELVKELKKEALKQDKSMSLLVSEYIREGLSRDRS